MLLVLGGVLWLLYSFEFRSVCVVIVFDGSCLALGKRELVGFGFFFCNICAARCSLFTLSLRKHNYSNILKNSPPKTESFQIKVQIIFTFLLKT